MVSPKATAGHDAFPLGALRARLGKNPALQPWADYLPCALRPGGIQRRRTGSDLMYGDEPGNESPQSSAAAVAGHVWALSQDARGCRRVQRAFDVEQDETLVCLASELKGHVLEASRCPHGNHVVSKCIMALKPSSLQFVIEEFMMQEGALVEAAYHRYGCRIVQRLVKHCPAEQTRAFVDVLLADAEAMCQHPYGNYVVQCLLEFGSEEQRRRIVQVLEKRAALLCKDSYGLAVMSSALVHGTPSAKALLIRAVLEEPLLLESMVLTRNGHFAVRVLLKTLGGLEREKVCGRLLAEAGRLGTSRFGRALLEESLV